ncbi:MAG: polysaccharide transporter [Deltaproteobacteria bacterium]|nr:MAG: polysaccharide transporter [Deltaproteobacteria bacterium]TMQ15523.1 MAG: polysaccharide transporter [Deltaproteobacteria bacterium]
MRAATRNFDLGRILAVLALVLGAACPSTLPKYPYDKEPDPRNKEIVLGVGDAVSINVWENKDLNTDATIRPDGMITMPLIGDLKAVGETPTTLKDKIKTRLKDFVRMQGTDITIAVRSWKSYRFTIQGEVQHAGVFSADQYVTVADALALAGGLSRFAKRNEVQVLRRDAKSGEVRKIPIDYDAIASGKRQDMNICVLAGDTIWVP